MPSTYHSLFFNDQILSEKVSVLFSLVNTLILYYVIVRSYSTLQYAELNGKTDRNVRGVRETAIKQIRKKYKTALETRLLHLPWTLTLDEKYFLENGVRTKDEKNSEKQ